MGRVMRETGADGIRLDEYGHMGWACFSTLHPHTWSEPGVSQWQKAVAEATRMVREAMDAAVPGSVLTTEHPGYDYLMAQIEGCITYDLTGLASPLRPLECNLQRFYFPECKPYELDHRGKDRQCTKRFWNAVGAFGRYYPDPFHVVLRENQATYAERDCRALVPGLARAVYVNRFGSRPKSIFHIYNATGHTFDGETLALDPGPDRHAFDLLEAREVQTRALPDGRQALRTYLERGAVACIALLPRLLGPVTRAADGWRVEIPAETALRPGDTIALADRAGRTLASCDARPGSNRIGAGAPADTGSGPACVKLLRAGQLLDASR
jgi:hypothetical protein